MMQKSNHGYITLFSILIISAIAASLALTLVLIGIGSAKTGLTFGQARQSEQLATACAEEAMEKIRTDANFTGADTLNYSSGTCTYTVTNGGGQNRTIDASGIAGEALRRVKVQLTSVTPNLVVSSWQDVASF